MWPAGRRPAPHRTAPRRICAGDTRGRPHEALPQAGWSPFPERAEVLTGEHHVIAGIGVDEDGHKHMLGLRGGATENAVVVTGLLEDLVARGVDPPLRRLFVIDGSKALRTAIDAVFGTDNPVQRCRNHKVENVMGHLPQDLRDQVKTVMKAAYRLASRRGWRS